FHDQEVIDLLRFNRIYYERRDPILETMRRIRAWAYELNWDDPDWQDEAAPEMARQAALLREIIGNPFHARIIDAVWLAWHDSTIPRMAQRIYDERRFDDLPI